MSAYEDALARCTTANAPWFVVPSNRKWFRNMAIAEAIVHELRPYREAWLESLKERGQSELSAIRAARSERGRSN